MNYLIIFTFNGNNINYDKIIHAGVIDGMETIILPPEPEKVIEKDLENLINTNSKDEILMMLLNLILLTIKNNDGYKKASIETIKKVKEKYENIINNCII